jgi:hypothetical protein
VSDQNLGWERLNLDEAPEENASPAAPAKLDPTIIPGYLEAKSMIADCGRPWRIEFQGVDRNTGEVYVRKAFANFFQAYAVMEDGQPIIKLNGSAVSCFWDKEKGREVPGEKPYHLQIAHHRIDKIEAVKGRLEEIQPAPGFVKLWPGSRQKGAMPIMVKAEFVAMRIKDGWLENRSLEVLA